MRAGIFSRCLVWASLALRCSSIFAPFDPESPPRYCSVFVHLVKSGGQSIKTQLRNESVTRGMPQPGHCSAGLGSTTEMCMDALHSSTVVEGSGEELRNSFVDEGRDCEFFTMMRHPIGRAVSAFYYCHHERPDKWCGHAEGQEGELSERFLDFVSNKWRNRAYQSLARSFICIRGFAFCKPEHERNHAIKFDDSPESWDVLRKVEKLLLSYNAVGITEQWSLSMQLFDARVKSPVEHWDGDATINAGVQASARTELTEWAYNNTELHNLLAADLHIYRFATDIFKQQTAESLGVTWDSNEGHKVLAQDLASIGGN